MAAFGPRERIGLDFASATLDVAQHPSAGVAKVGARLARFAVDGILTPAQTANIRLTDNEKRNQVGITVASHNLAGVVGVPPKSLANSVPFAFEGLVLGGIVTAGAEFAKGENGRVLNGISVDGREVPVIDVPTTEQRDAFADLAGEPLKMESFGHALGKIAAEVANPMSGIQDPIDHYHAELTSVSARFAGSNDHGGRMIGLGAARDQFAEDVRPFMLAALPSTMGEVTGNVLVENVLRHNPTGQLVGQYFAAPQA